MKKLLVLSVIIIDILHVLLTFSPIWMLISILAKSWNLAFMFWIYIMGGILSDVIMSNCIVTIISVTLLRKAKCYELAQDGGFIYIYIYSRLGEKKANIVSEIIRYSFVIAAFIGGVILVSKIVQ